VDLQDQPILDILEKEKSIIEKSDDIQCDVKNLNILYNFQRKHGWINPKSFKAILKFMKSKFKIS
jgi:hypothetical protein